MVGFVVSPRGQDLERDALHHSTRFLAIHSADLAVVPPMAAEPSAMGCASCLAASLSEKRC